MEIRKTLPADLPRVMEIYACARKFMAETGNPNQWGPTNWPPESLIRRDIREGHSYVCLGESGQVIGTFFFTHGKDIEPTYRVITDGAWLDGSDYGVVHRIASDGSGGILKAAVEFAAGHVDYLRIDTHADNHVMQKAVQKQGFRYCGIIYIADGTPRLAYDRI